MSYRMSFTSASLSFQESLVLAEAYQSVGDWEYVKKEAYEKNLLQVRKPSSAKRNIREICGRLQLLTKEEITLLLNGSRGDQLCMLWLAICKRYRFIREFAKEVVREKYLKLDTLVSYEDYDAFFNGKAEWDEGLDALSESTRKKLRQVVFRLMHEAEILSPQNMINPFFLSPEAASAIRDDDPA